MHNSLSLIRAVVNFGDGSQLNTRWYKKGNPKIIEAMLHLVRRARKEVSKVKWERRRLRREMEKYPSRLLPPPG